MIKLWAILLTLAALTGCGFYLAQIESGVNGGMRRTQSGGEVIAENPSGHWEKRGDWMLGSDLRFIFKRDKGGK